MTAITVTAEHIARGRPGSGNGCAIALALRETFPDSAGARVGDYADVFYDDEDLDIWAALPEAARRFARDFDDGRPVSPFTFDLDFPEAAA